MSSAPRGDASMPASPHRRMLTVATLGGLALLALQAYRWRERARDQGIDGIVVHPQPLPMAALRFVGAAGVPTSLTAWRGRPVVLNLWATWCAPCREEMPSLERLQATLGGERLVVLAVSVDADADVVPPFLRALGIERLHVGHDAFHDAGALAAAGIPITLLIDSEGREVARRRGPARWDDAAVIALIERLLLQPPRLQSTATEAWPSG